MYADVFTSPTYWTIFQTLYKLLWGECEMIKNLELNEIMKRASENTKKNVLQACGRLLKSYMFSFTIFEQTHN